MNRSRNSRELLQQMRANKSRMPTGTAGQDLDPFNPGVKAVVERQCDRPLRRKPRGQMPSHPESSRLGLLMDFLEHEVAEMSLVSHLLSSAELGRQPVLTLTRSVVQLHTQRREQRNLTILHRQNCACESSQRRRVAGAEEFTFSEADEQRRCFAGNNQSTRQLIPDHRQGIGTLKEGQHSPNGLQQQRSTGRFAC